MEGEEGQGIKIMERQNFQIWQALSVLFYLLFEWPIMGCVYMNMCHLYIKHIHNIHIRIYICI
jgi:hypothetical protein